MLFITILDKFWLSFIFIYRHIFSSLCATLDTVKRSDTKSVHTIYYGVICNAIWYVSSNALHNFDLQKNTIRQTTSVQNVRLYSVTISMPTTSSLSSLHYTSGIPSQAATPWIVQRFSKYLIYTCISLIL